MTHHIPAHRVSQLSQPSKEGTGEEPWDPRNEEVSRPKKGTWMEERDTTHPRTEDVSCPETPKSEILSSPRPLRSRLPKAKGMVRDATWGLSQGAGYQ